MNLLLKLEHLAQRQPINMRERKEGRKEGREDGMEGRETGRKEGKRRPVSFIPQKFYYSNLSTEIINLQVNMSH